VSIHLVGGGFTEDYDGAVFRPFIAEAATRAAGAGRMVPRIAIVLVGYAEDEAPAIAERYRAQFRRAASCEPLVTSVPEGALLDSAVLSDIDGLVIGGGLAPAYFDAVTPASDEIRLLVGDGLPYLGFSAGAMIAADAAIIGGWRIDGVAVASEEVGEDLDEITVAAGLALVDVSIDVHAAQWGTLTRLIAATEAGLVDGGIAIDEFTVLIVDDDGFRVEGTGNVWQVDATDDGSIVRVLGAS
jgi:cyanophycinase